MCVCVRMRACREWDGTGLGRTVHGHVSDLAKARFYKTGRKSYIILICLTKWSEKGKMMSQRVFLLLSFKTVIFYFEKLRDDHCQEFVLNSSLISMN